MFLSRNKKNNVYPCKSGVEGGSKLYRRVFMMSCVVQKKKKKKKLFLRCIRFLLIFLFSIDVFNNKCQENTSVDSLLIWECTLQSDSQLFERGFDSFLKTE